MSLSFLPFAALPVISTLAGGYVVYAWKKDLHPWLSFSGGILLAVAFLDLLPEALERGAESHLTIQTITFVTLLAILAFHVLDKTFSFHAHHEHPDGQSPEPCENDGHRASQAFARAGAMIFHSVLDGVAIGGGFAVDVRLGVLVTLAVMMHDFSDGMSTVTVLKHGLGHRHRSILPLLLADAIAPFGGALIGSVLAPNQKIISLMLAVFAGFFLFLSLADLLPQAHQGKMSRKFGIFLTTLGIVCVIFIQSIMRV